MTKLEDKFSKVLEYMELILALHKRELISKEEAYARLYIASQQVETLALKVKNESKKSSHKSS